ncbi:MAG: serine/threonine-protein kinase, partial [Acidobacteriota bacterium]
MEHVEGDSLQARLAKGPLATDAILDIGIQLADALAEAHAHGITHRDIKPANIMVSSRGHVKVLDFGLAKADRSALQAADTEAATQTMTQPGLVVGTVPYMSPEQALGKEVDSRSDLFSLGAVLYEMAAGRRPFDGQTPTETITRIASADPEPIAGGPAELERVVRKCLEKDPERRYQTAREIVV